jgi:hypothetical protein
MSYAKHTIQRTTPNVPNQRAVLALASVLRVSAVSRAAVPVGRRKPGADVAQGPG